MAGQGFVGILTRKLSKSLPSGKGQVQSCTELTKCHGKSNVPTILSGCWGWVSNDVQTGRVLVRHMPLWVGSITACWKSVAFHRAQLGPTLLLYTLAYHGSHMCLGRREVQGATRECQVWTGWYKEATGRLGGILVKREYKQPCIYFNVHIYALIHLILPKHLIRAKPCLRIQNIVPFSDKSFYPPRPSKLAPCLFLSQYFL